MYLCYQYVPLNFFWLVLSAKMQFCTFNCQLKWFFCLVSWVKTDFGKPPFQNMSNEFPFTKYVKWVCVSDHSHRKEKKILPDTVQIFLISNIKVHYAFLSYCVKCKTLHHSPHILTFLLNLLPKLTKLIKILNFKARVLDVEL